MPEREEFHYITRDPALVKRVRDWFAARRDYVQRAKKLAKKLGREPTIYEGFSVWGLHLYGFRPNKGEPHHVAGWKGTPWVLNEKNGDLRPRATHPEGKRIAAEIKALGAVKRPQLSGLTGLDTIFSAPGIRIIDDAVLVTTSEKCRCDKRWSPLKKSEYHKMNEDHEAKQKKTKKAVKARA